MNFLKPGTKITKHLPIKNCNLKNDLFIWSVKEFRTSPNQFLIGIFKYVIYIILESYQKVVKFKMCKKYTTIIEN